MAADFKALSSFQPNDPALELPGDLMDDIPLDPTGRDEEADLRRRRAQARADLSAHVRLAFGIAYEHRRTAKAGKYTLAERLQLSQRLYYGQYSDEELAAIRSFRGNETNVNLISAKCRDMKSWLSKVSTNKLDRGFSLKPSKIPDLSPAIKAQIDAETDEILAGIVAQSPGVVIDQGDVEDMREQEYDLKLKAIRTEATKRAERMEEKIEDQLQEGGFEEANNEFDNYLTFMPYAVLKGPIVEPSEKFFWDGIEAKVEQKNVLAVRAVAPADFLKEPNATSVQDGYTLELANISRMELSRMRGAENWDEEEIEAVLATESATSERAYLTEELEREELEGRSQNITAGVPGNSFCGIWMYDDIQGQRLMDWGADWATDPQAWYPTCLYLIGNHVVYAGLNPDPLGHKPYYVASFLQLPGSWCGIGLAELLEDAGNDYRAAIRNLVDAIALVTRPNLVVDTHTVDKAFEVKNLVPGAPVFYNSAKFEGQAHTQKPFEYATIPSHIPDLMNVADKFETIIENLSLIPRFVHGSADIGGAGNTSSGLMALMEASADGARNVMANKDLRVTRPLIDAYNRWDIKYLPDSQWGPIKGDYRAEAGGIMELLVKEAADQRLAQALEQASNNENILAIIGQEGLATMLRHVYRRNNIPDDVVPDEEKIKSRQQQMAMAQQAAPVAVDPATGAAMPIQGGPPNVA